MQTVSITTDWGTSGLYAGLFKAKLVQRVPDVQIVEISHAIEPYKVADAVFALKNAYPYFAPNTIHIISVASMGIQNHSKNREFVCFKYNNQYFIGPNNGLWSLLLPEKIATVYKIDTPRRAELGGSFIESEIFVDAVQKISSGMQPEEIGEAIECYQGPIIGAPVVEQNVLRGNLLYFDVYGNAITNITRAYFDNIGKGRPFTITVARENMSTNVLSNDYDESTNNVIIAMFNTSGYLEIAIPFASLRKFLHAENTMSVEVKFFDSTDNAQELVLQ